METATLPPHDPYPLDPRHEHVVDGAHVALRWEPAEGAAAVERYRVQIALDPDFYEVVFEQDVPAGATTLIVQRHFPEDDRTFYWRVLAGNDGGWSEGARIESFISGTAAQVGRFADPDEAEPFGPVAALFRATSLETLAEITPGRQPAADRALGERAEGVEGAELVTANLGLLLAAALVVAVVLFALFFAAC